MKKQDIRMKQLWDLFPYEMEEFPGMELLTVMTTMIEEYGIESVLGLVEKCQEALAEWERNHG